MKVIPYQDVIQRGNEKLNNYIKSSSKRNKLSHYTSVSTLELILKAQMLKLNRIDKVNDLREKTYLGEDKTYSRVFISCFSHNEYESIPQWYIYTQGENGVRITLNLDKNLNINCSGLLNIDKKIQVFYSDDEVKQFEYSSHLGSNLYINSELKWRLLLSNTDVIYSDELKNENPIIKNFNDRKMVDIKPLAKIKEKAWSFEDETRIIGLFQTVYDGIEFEIPSHILIPIDFSKIKISITLNPWSTDDFERKVRMICSTNLHDCDFEILKSTLHGTLKKRGKD